MKPSVLVFSYNITTSLGVIRSLGAAGYQVDFFGVMEYAGKGNIIAASKYVRKATEVVGRQDEKIIALLIDLYQMAAGRWVLFPTDDYCASLMDRYKDRLENVFKMPHLVTGVQGSVTHLMNKTVQSELAAECGISVAWEKEISLREDELSIPPDMEYPCFVKPLSSVDGRKVEMGVCIDEADLRKKLKTMQGTNRNRSILVQEFLHITQEYSMSGVCMDQTVVLPAVVKKQQIAQYRRGTTLVGELEPLDTIKPAKSAVFEFLKRIRYIGMFDLEIFMADGKLYFGELNLRSGGPNYSYYASGVNLPNLAVRAICGEEIEPVQDIEHHKVFFHDQDGWEDYQHGYITKKQLKTYYDQADVLLLASKEDPKPGKVFLKEVKRQMMIGRIKRIKRCLRGKKQ